MNVAVFGRQHVSSNVQILILDVKNANSIQEAVKTVKRLLPPSAGRPISFHLMCYSCVSLLKHFIAEICVIHQFSCCNRSTTLLLC